MKPERDNEQRYYAMPSLHRWFAVSSVLLLLGTLALIYHDHYRPWKVYQRDFRDRDIALTENRLAQLHAAIEEQAAPTNSAETVASNDDPFAEAGSSEADTDPFADATAETGPTDDEGEYPRSLEDLQQEAMLLERKLAKIAPEHMGAGNRFIGLFRDLPILDLSAPTYRVEQIVVHDSTEDLHFLQVPRVDRCTTCHLGMGSADFADEEEPLTTHPRLELFVAGASPHPKESFGCTTCHQGRGRGTEFNSTTHTPATPEQEEEWIATLGWKEDHHWEEPMLETPYLEASCLTCHREESRVPGADKLNWGLALIEQAGCYSCHAIDRLGNRPKRGPSLRHLASKTTPDWVQAWISNPPAKRPDTWMPHVFSQTEGVTGLSNERIAVETKVMTDFLFGASEDFDLTPAPEGGDSARGKRFFQSLGCAACHLAPEEDAPAIRTQDSLGRMHGPHLTGLVEKTDRDWLFHWLKDPSRYNPNTAMPNLRLSDDEAVDLTAYLLGVTGDVQSTATAGTAMLPGANTRPAAPVTFDDALAKSILREHRARRESADALDAALAALEPEVLRYELGERLVAHYGCTGCHEIPGTENAALIGPELSGFGGKSLHEFDFGKVDVSAHRRSTWLAKKLESPRIFDQGLTKAPIDRLRMPQFGFSGEEREAMMTALLGFRKMPEGLKLDRPLDQDQGAIEAGRRLVREHNCTGCHVIEGEGGNVFPTLTQWLQDTKGYSDDEAVAMTPIFGPPQLRGEGKKVQSAWLFDFLRAPEVIRPWISVRMPTYTFTDAQRNSLVQYFSALEGEPFPFVAAPPPDLESPLFAAGKTLFSKDYFDCANCHIQGDIFPTGEADRWAPDFALSARRLKPAWLQQWLYDPQVLEPGTKMPTYFDPEYFDDAGPDDILDGDEHQHILALKDYVLAIALEVAQPKAQTAALPEVLQEVEPTETPATEMLPTNDPFADSVADDDPFADSVSDESDDADPFADSVADEKAPADEMPQEVTPVDPVATETAPTENSDDVDPFADSVADEETPADEMPQEVVPAEPAATEAVSADESDDVDPFADSIADVEAPVAEMQQEVAPAQPEATEAVSTAESDDADPFADSVAEEGTPADEMPKEVLPTEPGTTETAPANDPDDADPFADSVAEEEAPVAEIPKEVAPAEPAATETAPTE